MALNMTLFDDTEGLRLSRSQGLDRKVGRTRFGSSPSTTDTSQVHRSQQKVSLSCGFARCVVLHVRALGVGHQRGGRRTAAPQGTSITPEALVSSVPLQPRR